MLTIISPAKTLDYQSPLISTTHTLPECLEATKQLITVCKKLTSDDLAKLMSISPKLAAVNYERFQNWHPDFNLQNARQAILAFKGDVYMLKILLLVTCNLRNRIYVFCLGYMAY